MKKRQFISLIFLSVLILFSGKLAVAMSDMHAPHMMGNETEDDWCENDHGMKPMMNRGMDPWDMIKEKLNLSDEENEKLGKIFYEYRKEMLTKGAAIEIAEMDLTWLLKTKKSDRKTIIDTLNKLEALKTSLNTFRVESLLKTKDFLSEDQYKDLAKYLLEWMAPNKMKGECHDCMHGMKGRR